MALQFRPYDDAAGRETRARWAGSIDDIFNAYQRAQEQGRITEQDRIAAEARAGAERERQGRNLLQYGFDPRQVTPEVLARSQPGMVPQGPAAPGAMSPEQSENPMFGALRSYLEKKKSTATMSTQEQQLRMEQIRAGIDRDKAQAELDRAKAAAEASGGGPSATAKRPAATEFNARGFADKARQANESLEKLIMGGFDPSSNKAMLGGVLPNIFKPSDVQQLEQARRQFVNAILRRESGAAIPESELANYNRQYFPMPGDSQQVLGQKAQARRLAIAGLESEGSRVPSALPSTGVGGGAIRVQLPDGRIGNIPADKLDAAISRGARRL